MPKILPPELTLRGFLAYWSGVIVESANTTETSANPDQNTSNGAGAEKPADKPWYFTRENAKELSAKGHAAKRRLREERRKAIAGNGQSDEEAYKSSRLMRTREQIEELDKQLDKATSAKVVDSKAIKAICDSIKALSEVERILAGRPLPGSHRPTRNPSKSAPKDFTPTE